MLPFLTIDSAELVYNLLMQATDLVTAVTDDAGTVHIYGPPGRPRSDDDTDPSDDTFTPWPAVIYVGSGGPGDVIPISKESYQFRCYGRTAQEARYIYRLLDSFLHDKPVSYVTVSSGTALFQYGHRFSGPLDSIEPQTGWNYVLAQYTIHFGSYLLVVPPDEGGGSDVAYVRTLFVGKHGDDTNAGTDPSLPFLTFDAAIDAAALLSPAAGSKVAIWCMDSGTYTESIIQPDWCDLFAPSAVLRGTLTLGDHASSQFDAIIATGNSQRIVYKPSGSGASHVKANIIDGTGSAAGGLYGSGTLSGVQCLRNDAGAGILIAAIDAVFVGQNGDGLGDRTVGQGHSHLISHDFYLAGNNALGIAGNITNSTIIATIGHIKELNNASNTQAIRVGSSGDVYVITNQIIADTAFQINGAGNLRLFCPDVQGAQIGTVSCLVSDDAIETQAYRVNGIQVVGLQQAAIANATAGTVVDRVNDILVALRTHGLIDT